MPVPLRFICAPVPTVIVAVILVAVVMSENSTLVEVVKILCHCVSFEL